LQNETGDRWALAGKIDLLRNDELEVGQPEIPPSINGK
jgi:hypothetical protein